METAIWKFGKFDLSSVLHDGIVCITNLVDTFSKCHVLHVSDRIDLDL